MGKLHCQRPLRLEQKTWGYQNNKFGFSGVIDTAESTSNSNISAKSKLSVKLAQGKMSDGKNQR